MGITSYIINGVWWSTSEYEVAQDHYHDYFKWQICRPYLCPNAFGDRHVWCFVHLNRLNYLLTFLIKWFKSYMSISSPFISGWSRCQPDNYWNKTKWCLVHGSSEWTSMQEYRVYNNVVWCTEAVSRLLCKNTGYTAMLFGAQKQWKNYGFNIKSPRTHIRLRYNANPLTLPSQQ